MTEFVRSPGYDWTVWYEDDGVVEAMSVFGVMTAEEAKVEALWSLNALMSFTGVIVRVERVGMEGASR